MSCWEGPRDRLKAGERFVSGQSDRRATSLGRPEHPHRESGQRPRRLRRQPRQSEKDAAANFVSFTGMIRALIPKSKYLTAAPTLPNFGAAESKFLGSFEDAATL